MNSMPRHAIALSIDRTFPDGACPKANLRDFRGPDKQNPESPRNGLAAGATESCASLSGLAR
jgi:hypothetical protein